MTEQSTTEALHTRVLSKIVNLELAIEHDAATACELRAQAEQLELQAEQQRTILAHFHELLQEDGTPDGEPSSPGEWDTSCSSDSAQDSTAEQGLSCADAIRQLLSQSPTEMWSNADLARHLPTVRRATIGVTVNRLASSGELERVGRGRVRAGAGLNERSVDGVRTRIVGLLEQDPTRCWPPRELATAIGASSDSWLWKQLAQLVERGALHRNSDGTYQSAEKEKVV